MPVWWNDLSEPGKITALAILAMVLSAFALGLSVAKTGRDEFWKGYKAGTDDCQEWHKSDKEE